MKHAKLEKNVICLIYTLLILFGKFGPPWIFNIIMYVIIFMSAYIYTHEVGLTDNESTQHFSLRKTVTSLTCAPDGVQTRVMESVGSLSLTLYQSHPRCILTYSRLKKKDPLIGLGFYQWGPIISMSPVPHYG